MICLCVIFPRYTSNENLGFDYLGILVGVLSLLVTLLIGWQIYNSISINKRLRQWDKEKEKLMTRIDEYDKNMIQVKSDVLSVVLSQAGKAFYEANLILRDRSILLFLNSLAMFFLSDKHSEDAKNAYEYSIMCLKKDIKNYFGQEIENEEEYYSYKVLALKTKVPELIKWADSLKLKDKE